MNQDGPANTTMTSMRRTLLAAAAVFAASSAPAAGPEPVYDAFPKAVIGSARTVALGGAIVADPDGYEAVVVNPAGLSGMVGRGIDFGSDGNTVDNFVVDLDDPKSRSLNIPLKYSFAGARWVGERWGFGFVSQTPFSFDDEFNGTARVRRNGVTSTVTNTDLNKISNSAQAYTVAAARSFVDGTVGVGLSLDYVKASERYEFIPVVAPSSTAVKRELNEDAITANLGVLWQPRKWLRAGLTFHSGYAIGFDSSRNAGLPNNLAPFRDLKTPDRVRIGLRLAPREDLRIFLQGRLVNGMKNTFVVGSGIFPNAPGSVIESGRRTTLDGGWGVEYIPFDKDDLTVKLWGGGYLEDSDIQGGYTRYHRTAGFSFSPWFIGLSMAVDDAELYNNFVVGLGVDLLKAAQSASKRFGWKLPL